MDALEDYIFAHNDKQPEYLKKILRETNVVELNRRMSCGHFEGRLLSLLSNLIKPTLIVEIGCFTAYSTLCLAEGLAPEGIIHTFEIDEELEDTILHNISQSPYANKCQLHIGDARKLLKTTTFNRPIDMAFIDGDKCQYSEYYNLLIDKVSSGGVIIADNTLWNNKITCVNPKDKQLAELQKFNDYVIADSRVSTTLLPIRDGITILRVL